MTTATEHARDLFMTSALNDDDLGYPDAVAFVATDIEGWQEIVWRSLRDDGVSTVVVASDGIETMLAPLEQPLALRWLRRIGGRVPVRVRVRSANGAVRPDTRLTITRAALKRLRFGEGDAIRLPPG